MDEIVTRLRRALTPRTRVVALTWVHSSTGVKLAAARDLGGAARRGPVAVRRWCSRLRRRGRERPRPALRLPSSSGCHKWLFGPRGTGVLWAGPRIRGLLRPAIPSFDDGVSLRRLARRRRADGVADGARLTPGGFHSFEHRWALAEAFGFHERSDGRASRPGSARSLPGSKPGLGDVRSVQLGRPPLRRCRRVSCASTSRAATRRTSSPGSLPRGSSRASRLYARRHVRLGPGIVNTVGDVDAAVRAVAAL